MPYQALARKWRPRTFSEIVGQEHVVRALTHALEFDRMHHAYLFTGTRGVGKTTIARILAKALNCEDRKTYDPCGECVICREVDEGRFVDLIEVDAASRTKVEDTRDLLENVQYAPNQGRYKVYLIDEVHMLSGHSFNALLKTLEEPPPHIKFLLATTDPQKIPVTVLSRCLQFNLKRLTPDQIRAQMEEILRRESIEYEAAAVKLLARAAEGSMRDGLSLLDQAIVHGGGRLREAEVSLMLGTVARHPVFELLSALAEGDAATLLRHIEQMAEHTPNFADVLQQILIILHHASLAQWIPEAIKREDDADLILNLAQRIGAEDLQLFYQIGLIGQRDLPLAPDPRSGFEMVMLRMLAFRPATKSADLRSAVDAAPPRKTDPPKIARPLDASPVSMPTQVEAEPAPEPIKTEIGTAPAPPASRIGSSHDWHGLIQAMGVAGLTRELANNCVLQDLDEKSCILVLDPQHAHLRVSRVEANLEKALRDYFRSPLKLTIKIEAPGRETPASLIQREKEERQRTAEIEIEQDENIRALKERFDARIIPGSTKPID
ncbi:MULTISPECIES: DNA polymerase III subunit gamma/tau [Methylocaldum]|jgi:DNA polymerase-3 subunit gamma/tau|uniref:DNA polymerase III subunit gamma/tau n=1 Tax=unclassified Methylocaldum TaxID=2622260 RepID=UPI00098AB9EB|nr:MULTISPECIES: DNA polymerase III subunit gamma/tau [unclassified Methylocaldum]MVF20780.1 DNA polymerase III subunit gamma/tau [Methylocaldum sp. BRCS4]